MQKLFQNGIAKFGNPVKLYRGSVTIASNKRVTLNDETLVGTYYGVLSFNGGTHDKWTNVGVNGGQMGRVIFGSNVLGILKDRDCLQDIWGREWAVVGQPTYQGTPNVVAVECLIEELSYKPKGVV